MTAPAEISVVDDDRYDLGLFTLLRVLLRRWWVVALCLGLVLGFTVSNLRSRVPVYEAYTDVRINEAQGDVIFGLTGVEATDPTRVMESEQLFMQGVRVWETAEERIGTDTMSAVLSLDAEIQGRADVIRVRITSHDPEAARLAADAIAESYRDERIAMLQEGQRTLAEHMQRSAAEYRREIVVLTDKIQELLPTPLDDSILSQLRDGTAENATVQAAIAAAALAVDDTELAELQAELETARQLAVEFRSRANQVEIDSTVASAGAQILAPATIVQGAIGPTAQRTLMVAIISGVALGLAAAFAVDFLDDRMRDAAVAERDLRGITTLGHTPRAKVGVGRRKLAASLSHPTSPTADAFRILRAMLIGEAQRQPVQTLLVTSPQRKEGKTTITANLGIALARAGVNVVVIDANLRRPAAHHQFGVPSDPGLTSVLSGAVPLSQALFHIQSSTIAGSLRVLSAGPTNNGPSTALVDGNRFADVLGSLRADADVILIDSPAVGAGSDARVLAGLVDGAIVVARRKVTRRRRLGRTLDMLRRTGVPVMWTVLNGFGSRNWEIDLSGRSNPTQVRRGQPRTQPVARGEAPQRA